MDAFELDECRELLRVAMRDDVRIDETRGDDVMDRFSLVANDGAVDFVEVWAHPHYIDKRGYSSSTVWVGLAEFTAGLPWREYEYPCDAVAAWIEDTKS